MIPVKTDLCIWKIITVSAKAQTFISHNILSMSVFCFCTEKGEERGTASWRSMFCQISALSVEAMFRWEASCKTSLFAIVDLSVWKCMDVVFKALCEKEEEREREREGERERERESKKEREGEGERERERESEGERERERDLRQKGSLLSNDGIARLWWRCQKQRWRIVVSYSFGYRMLEHSAPRIQM